MKHKRILITATLAVLGIMAGTYIGYDIGYENAASDSINSFEDCVEAGYPIMESYPEQCAVPGRKSFTKNY